MSDSQYCPCVVFYSTLMIDTKTVISFLNLYCAFSFTQSVMWCVCEYCIHVAQPVPLDWIITVHTSIELTCVIIVLSRKLKPSIVSEGCTFPGQIDSWQLFFQPFPQCHPLFYVSVCVNQSLFLSAVLLECDDWKQLCVHYSMRMSETEKNECWMELFKSD